ncbi:hypothetical protein [Flammeovirga pacifica]|uniref:Uncharacterized protein n=1 Tax=Flammeovirga pacifica TaxID=915059 RepID=A0A1S1Z527_FLAPC|nr:hypothetical protein [Flammeovirga pacifica]OHX68380.1 hypothetical protein NH26_19510 [Flammeovirga pacifica]
MTRNEAEFRRRKENTDFLQFSIQTIENDIKSRIRKIAIEASQPTIDKLTDELDAYTAILIGLTGVWSEALIKHLVLDNGVFNNTQAQAIISSTALKEKWLLTYKCALTNAYSIPTARANLIASKEEIRRFFVTNTRNSNQVNNTYGFIEEIMEEVRDFRNKIQHGDWKHGYTKNSARVYVFDDSATQSLRSKNLLTERLRRHQIKQLYLMIFDLYSFRRLGKFRKDNSSKPSIYFFPKRYGQLKKLKGEIRRVDFSKYVNDMMYREQQGKLWRRRQTGYLSWLYKMIGFLRKN